MLLVLGDKRWPPKLSKFQRDSHRITNSRIHMRVVMIGSFNGLAHGLASYAVNIWPDLHKDRNRIDRPSTELQACGSFT